MGQQIHNFFLKTILLSVVAHAALFGAVYLAIKLTVKPPLVATDIEWRGNISQTGANQGSPKKPKSSRKDPKAKTDKIAPKKYSFNFSQTVPATSEPAEDSDDTAAPEETSSGDGPVGGVASGFQVSSLPQVIREVKAEYPPEAKKQGREATVVLAVVVEEDGSVRSASTVKGAGFGFDERAVAALKQFKFTPATLNGKPVAVEIRYTYEFTLR